MDRQVLPNLLVLSVEGNKGAHLALVAVAASAGLGAAHSAGFLARYLAKVRGSRSVADHDFPWASAAAVVRSVVLPGHRVLRLRDAMRRAGLVLRAVAEVRRVRSDGRWAWCPKLRPVESVGLEQAAATVGALAQLSLARLVPQASLQAARRRVSEARWASPRQELAAQPLVQQVMEQKRAVLQSALWSAPQQQARLQRAGQASLLEPPREPAPWALAAPLGASAPLGLPHPLLPSLLAPRVPQPLPLLPDLAAFCAPSRQRPRESNSNASSFPLPRTRATGQ